MKFTDFNSGQMAGVILGIWAFNKFIGITDLMFSMLIITLFILEIVRQKWKLKEYLGKNMKE